MHLQRVTCAFVACSGSVSAIITQNPSLDSLAAVLPAVTSPTIPTLAPSPLNSIASMDSSVANAKPETVTTSIANIISSIVSIELPATTVPSVASVAQSTPAFTTFVTVALATETKIMTLMPLPSAEAKKQEAAYSKAQNVPNAVASQVKEALTAQGKAVPSALVPDQPKQTEVKHSGLENIVEILKNTDYNQVVHADPSKGFYMEYLNGTDPAVADAYAKKNNARMPHNIYNMDTKGMCVLGHAMNTATLKVTPFAFDTKTPMVYIAPNTTLQIGNFLPPGANKHNGRFQPKFNCDKDCKHCAGDGKGPIDTLFEYHHAKKADESTFTNWNPSNVDGLTSNFNMTLHNSAGVCKSRSCNVAAPQMKKTCPKASLWNDKGIYGCTSDCKVTGRDDHCCIGAFGTPDSCPPSSQFLHSLCPDAYSWAYDDKEHSDTCDGTTKVDVAFWPIS
ncbi:Osmotin, thaumatin-like protein [Mollisia scopiformis]|uniref:Osmotin, thaumatin-like protein n=1 Tax=Mollisia scopiformis TaxID=149040 RepID=A0A194XU95_MOLSC|nr:Osmotin, thaumatin-like protein [Mollisia scopiformis]KUJ23711.1 Osmotin, thaumatin-like protein [Mollisia scopiformis]